MLTLDDETMRKNLETTKMALAMILKYASPAVRVEFFAEIQADYCPHCGYPQPFPLRCHCDNDE